MEVIKENKMKKFKNHISNKSKEEIRDIDTHQCLMMFHIDLYYYFY